jgi:hypothetical protein
MDARNCCSIDGCVHSVTSAHVDLSIDNNGTWSDAFQYGEVGDTTWTLTGCTFGLDVQRNPYDLTPLLQLSSANGRILIDDVVQRVIHFQVAAADIQAALDPGQYVYDLVMTDTIGVRTPLMHGMLEVVQGVSYP